MSKGPPACSYWRKAMRRASLSESCTSMTACARDWHEHGGGSSHIRVRLVGTGAHDQRGGAALFPLCGADEAPSIVGRVPDHRRGAGFFLRPAHAASAANVL